MDFNKVLEKAKIGVVYNCGTIDNRTKYPGQDRKTKDDPSGNRDKSWMATHQTLPP